MSDQPGEGYLYRYNRLVTRLLSAKGGEPLQEIAAELVAAIILEGRFADPRFAHLGEDRLAAGFSALAASAGNNGQSKLVNPTGSGVLTWIEGLVVQVGGGNVDLFITSLGPAGWNLLTSFGFRDGRAKGTPVCAVYNQNNAGQAGGRLFRVPTPNSGTPTIIPVDIVVPPGFEFGCSNDTVNFASVHSYYWRERAMETSESGS